MATRTFGEWVFECDFEATRQAYALAPSGIDVERECSSNRNFELAKTVAFSPEFITFLQSLGIDPLKPSEVYHIGRVDSGLHLYDGWFHFVGQLHRDGDFAPVDFGNAVSASLSMRYASHVPLWASFVNRPLVQVCFHTELVPWLLDEPEPR